MFSVVAFNKSVRSSINCSSIFGFFSLWQRVNETNKIKIKTTGDVVAEAEYDISDLLLDEKEDDFLANFTLDDLE